jgi:hypothetical protein
MLIRGRNDVGEDGRQRKVSSAKKVAEKDPRTL